MIKRSKVKVTARHNLYKNSKNINNSAGDCLISLKFRIDFVYVTLDVPQTFKVNGQRSRLQRGITYQLQMRYNLGTDKLSKVKLGENYPSAERNA